MTDLLKTIYNDISKNNIKCFNYSKTREKALCLNIIELTNGTCLLTISVMSDKKKSATLDFKEFAKLMNSIENQLSKVAESVGCLEFPFLVPVHNKINNDWYKRLNCHRLFIVPTAYIFAVVQHLTTEDFAVSIRVGCGVSELSLYLDTHNNKLKITRFSKE